MYTTGKPQSDPEHFNHGYDLEARGLHMDPDRINRAALFLELIGDPTGKRILDLGGGTTLLGLMDEAEFYMVVDYSEVACGIVGQYIQFKSNHVGVCIDASEFLLTKRYPPFDVVCCFGLMDYMTETFITTLFKLAPAPVLCIACPLGQGYLQYEGRITAYDMKDFTAVAKEHGWKLAKQINSPDHAQLRYEKL